MDLKRLNFLGHQPDCCDHAGRYELRQERDCIEVLEYLIRLSKMQLAEWQGGPSKEAPISDGFHFFVGDGDPIKTCAGIIENTTTEQYSKIRPLPGVFHEFMGILQDDKPTQRGLDLILDRSILFEGRKQQTTTFVTLWTLTTQQHLSDSWGPWSSLSIWRLWWRWNDPVVLTPHRATWMSIWDRELRIALKTLLNLVALYFVYYSLVTFTDPPSRLKNTRAH